ncbi:hypothetical protein HEK616_83610 (plasmid) [Streptomyces nigrescens]|uniref:Uncharacterized protein n=1 Tax=Streptomyces nigrescens TaxID=1920 RepID=A0ABM8A822_STRNI|nr:hypothetical protein HEK616_83610 [Streptomyces nigrescens]
MPLPAARTPQCHGDPPQRPDVHPAANSSFSRSTEALGHDARQPAPFVAYSLSLLTVTQAPDRHARLPKGVTLPGKDRL